MQGGLDCEGLEESERRNDKTKRRHVGRCWRGAREGKARGGIRKGVKPSSGGQFTAFRGPRSSSC